METNRRAAWTPPPRPEWVAAVNREGAFLDLKGVVPLDPQSLIATAVANTGLSDFGSDDWREPFEIFCRGLDEEAGLNLMGRIMTRSDILRTLESRLHVEEAYRRHPEIEDEEIEKPIMIVGQGRTGTSALLNLLAADPANRAELSWEAMYPRADPAPEEEARLRALAHEQLRMWSRVTPELDATHEFGCDFPTESIDVQVLSWQSPAWQVLWGQTPSLFEYVARNSMIHAVRYEKRVLKLLQWRRPKRRWVLKNPQGLSYLKETFEVFPDLGLVWTHRDPIIAMSSMINLVGIFAWIRSDAYLAGGTVENVTTPAGAAAMITDPIDMIESGFIPRERLLNVAYDDFVSDPLGVATAIYKHFGIEMTDASHAALKRHVDDHPRSKRPAHRYNLGADKSRSAEREAFRRYQDYFNVPDEV